MDMLIGGKHISSEDLQEVKNPYDGEVIDTVPIAHRQTADLAIREANDAKESLVEMSAFKVSNKLYEVCGKLKDNKKDLAKLLTMEVGKPINEALVEMDRSIEEKLDKVLGKLDSMYDTIAMFVDSGMVIREANPFDEGEITEGEDFASDFMSIDELDFSID